MRDSIKSHKKSSSSVYCTETLRLLKWVRREKERKSFSVRRGIWRESYSRPSHLDEINNASRSHLQQEGTPHTCMHACALTLTFSLWVQCSDCIKLCSLVYVAAPSNLSYRLNRKDYDILFNFYMTFTWMSIKLWNCEQMYYKCRSKLSIF